MDLSPGSSGFFLLYEIPALIGVLLAIWVWIKVVHHLGDVADRQRAR